MLIPDVPPPNQGEEITIANEQRQEAEQELTRSNWRCFYAMQDHPESPLPGSGRKDEDSQSPR